MAKLDAKAFGIALGLVWGGLTFLLGILDMLYLWGESWSKMMTTIYMGYRPTIFGSLVGAFWGFIYAGFIGYAIARMYNRLVDENAKETEEKIKILARNIWEKKGKPSGSSADDWREAEKMIKGC